MLFAKQKCVFIHIPKTGGNYFTRCFLEYSDDAMVLSGHQDGVDRFELTGNVTQSKHQTLTEYVASVGPNFSEFKVYAFKRPPVERLVSLYYSPHLWMRLNADGSYSSVMNNDPIQLDKFENLIQNNKSICDLIDAENLSDGLEANRSARHVSGATVELLDFSQLSECVATFGQTYGFALNSAPRKKVNSSTVDNPMALNQHLMADIEALVHGSHHAEDLRFFKSL